MKNSKMAYDLIGDVHGQADKLEALLQHMGYVKAGRRYRAPIGRQAVFLGDLIDRGPGQVRVLEIARNMIDGGEALAIMGNHEFNAIGYLARDPNSPEGECYRPNRGTSSKCEKNRLQHAAFLAQVGEGSAAHQDWVNWFRSLPPFLDLGGLRAVHGCWDDQAIAVLREEGWVPGSPLNDELLDAAYGGSARLKWARELLTCGLELPLPEGRYILDKGLEWPADLVIAKIEGSPIFVGHHWFSGHPLIESPKLACLDWSAAAGGPLVAYRWDGEQTLRNEKLVWLPQA
jgi:hypothetical protein